MASLAVDALVDAGHVSRNDFDAAVSVVSKEIYVRLLINDYPLLKEET